MPDGTDRLLLNRILPTRACSARRQSPMVGVLPGKQPICWWMRASVALKDAIGCGECLIRVCALILGT